MQEEIKKELLRGLRESQKRGLLANAKWNAEIMTSIPASRAAPSHRKLFSTSSAENIISNESESFILAKTYFDVKEYQRVVHVLQNSNDNSLEALFLKCYASYLAGEKIKNEELLELNDERACVLNQNLESIYTELKSLYNENSKTTTLDGFCLYMLGVVCKAKDLKEEAKNFLVLSVKAYPCNWSAWIDLAKICSEKDEIGGLGLPNHFMTEWFMAHLNLELQKYDESLACYDRLCSKFGESSYLASQRALNNYYKLKYDEAKDMFEQLRKKDPFRLDNLDTYSNILFVKESRAELSDLAHKSVKIDKYRPETCFIIGNYYSVKGLHEKAVVYFKRALRLDCNYLAAWILIGHEYVEMKNTSAAIEAYRRATDINPNDHRGWYSLGQVYELLEMSHAWYYYKKATMLSPYDARGWHALGNCYEKQNRIEEAIKCYQRAELKDSEGNATFKLAKLYDKLGDSDHAMHYFTKHIESKYIVERHESCDNDSSEALLYLGNFWNEHGDFPKAEVYARLLVENDGPKKDEATALLRAISQLKNSAK